MKPVLPIKIEAGMTFVCDTLRWQDGWEFDFPSLMLAPVIRIFESGMGHDQIVEDVLIDAVCTGTLTSHSFEETWGWRGYKLPVLRRRFRESLAGKEFPVANYSAQRTVVQIVPDDARQPANKHFPNGKDLTWKEIPHGSAIVAVAAAGRKFINQALCH